MIYFCGMKKNKIVLSGSLILCSVLFNSYINKTQAQQLAFNDGPSSGSSENYSAAPAPQTVNSAEPFFPGGSDSLQNYLFTHIQTPDSLLSRDVSGSIYFSFVVESDGKIDKVKIENGVDSPGWDSAAINCIRTMPNWVPGSVNAKPKTMSCLLPVSVPPGHELYNMPDSVNIK